MSDTALQKRVPPVLKEKGQYFIAFGVIVSMLLVAKIPVFVVFFFGVFAYLVLKMLAAGSRSDTREIFEFYLSANEILRDDDRKWFGFEINDTIRRGEEIIHRLSAAPPLVHFALGALYNKTGDHKSAVKHLANILEREGGEEIAYVYPTPELRSYVKVLRKIEREPADAPLTSAAVRSLERARKLRGAVLLEESRVKFANGLPKPSKPAIDEGHPSDRVETQVAVSYAGSDQNGHDAPDERDDVGHRESKSRTERTRSAEQDPYADRKPISEVLHDIYDKNVQ